MGERILLFGGAFNPPHKGHEALLAAAIAELSPKRTFILPTAHSPHKRSGFTRFSHRAAMCRVFERCGDVTVSRIEARGRKKRNYSIKTIKRFKKRFPADGICFLIGGDMLESFRSWSRYRRILAEATLVVAAREEERGDELAAAVARLQSEGGDIVLLRYRPVEASSSDIRKKLAAGEDVSALVDASVLDYIRRHGLYKSGAAKNEG